MKILSGHRILRLWLSVQSIMHARSTSHPGPIPAFYQEAAGCRPGSWELHQRPSQLHTEVHHYDLPLRHGFGCAIDNIKTAELEKNYKSAMKDTLYFTNVALPLDFLGKSIIKYLN